MAEVVTKGRGEVERTADRAVVWVTYGADGIDRSSAVSALTQRVAAVEPLLDREGVETRARRLSINANWHGDRQVGVRAEQFYELRVTDPAVLDGLLGALIAAEPASLNGPTWELTDQTEAVAEAQRSAVADARRRAEGYAAALGRRVGALQRITDGDDQAVPYAAPAMAVRMDYAGEVSMPDVRELNLEPQPVTVTVGCTTIWSLLD